jgi:hypothetical protein
MMRPALGKSTATWDGVKKMPLPTTEATISIEASQSVSTRGSRSSGCADVASPVWSSDIDIAERSSSSATAKPSGTSRFSRQSRCPQSVENGGQNAEAKEFLGTARHIGNSETVARFVRAGMIGLRNGPGRTGLLACAGQAGDPNLERESK